MVLLQYSQPMGAPPGPTTPPILSPPGGSFSTSFTVVITAAPGALIFFTTDGSTPTFPISGTTQLYTGQITVAASETIRAIAVAPAFAQSLVSSGVYVIAQAATPTFAPGSGTYTTLQSVTILCTTPGSSIYYTTDGSIPTTGSTLYAGPITVQASETLNAIAVAPGFSQSAVGSAIYTINFVIVDISPSYGVVGIVNNGSVVPSGGLDNQSNAYSETLIGSAVNWAGFTFNIGPPGVVDAVSSATIALPAGNFLALDMLALGCHGNQAAQVFTVTYTDLTTTTFTQSVSDWFTPQNYAGESQALQMAYRVQPGGTTQNGPFYLFGYSFALNAAKVVKSLTLPNNRFVVALAVDLTTTSSISIAATPTFSPVAGSYLSAQMVTISTTTPAPTIYYTTDGTTPTTSSAVYSAPILVSATETVQAIATAAGYTQSLVGRADYTIQSGLVLGQYKWNPGYYITTQAIESGDQFGAPVQAEIDKIASYVGLPITGYVCCIHARHLENWTLTTNLNDPTNITTQYPGFLSNLEPIANYFWSKFPSGHFALYINFDSVGQNITNVTTYNYADGFYIPHHIATCGGSLTVPNSYGSSQTTTYALTPIYSGASYYGFGFAAFSGSAFGQVVPAFWNRAVNQRMMIQLFQALSMYKFQSGPFAGLTVDQIPQFEFVGTNDEYSYNMTGSQNLPTGPTVNTPGGSGQDAATNTNFFARRQDAYTKICAALPHTLFAGCESYGFDATGNDTGPILAGYINNYISGNGLSTIRGYACSNSDLFMTAWIPDPGNTLWSTPIQQGFLGISNPSSTPPLPAPTATSLVGKNPFIAQFQNGDYEQRLTSGTAQRSQAAVLGLIQAALGASPNGKIPTSHLCFCIADSTGGTSALDNYLHQALTTYVPQYPVAANLPTTLMFAPLNFNALIGPNQTVSISWTVPSGVGPNMTYDVLDGSTVVGNSTTSPLLLSNVAIGSHSYTLRMKNPNGVGPQTSAIVVSVVSMQVGNSGGLSASNYGGMPVFQDRVMESKGCFYNSSGSAFTTLDANGWPTTDWQSGLGELANFSIAPNWNSGTYKCGYTSKGNGPASQYGYTTSVGGTEVINAGGCTISNLQYNVGTKAATFDLVSGGTVNFNFSVTGTTGGATNIFAMLPAYGANVSYNISGNLNNLFTNEYVAKTGGGGTFKCQRGLDWSNVIWNLQNQTWAIRNTPTNTKGNKGWTSNKNNTIGATNKEGWPIDWLFALCNQTNSDAWYHVPWYDDGTYAQGLANLAISTLGNGRKCWIELENEMWNTGDSGIGSDMPTITANFMALNPGYIDYDGAYTFTASSVLNSPTLTYTGTLPTNVHTNQTLGGPGVPQNTSAIAIDTVGQTVTMSHNATSTNNSKTYATQGSTQDARMAGDRIARMAASIKSAIGSQFGQKVKVVLAWQSGGLFYANAVIAFIQKNYGPVQNYVHAFSIAPYMDRNNTSVPGDGVDHRGSNDTLAQIQTQLTANGTYQPFLSLSENYAILAMHYGLDFIAYECGWETAGEGTISNITNMGAAIMDSGMQSVVTNNLNVMLNSGYSLINNTAFGASCVPPSGGTAAQEPDYGMSSDPNAFVTSGSPRYNGLTAVAGGTQTYTRNVVSGSGSVIDAINYADNNSLFAKWLAAGTYPYLGQVSYSFNRAFVNVSYYLINCTAAGNYSLVVHFINTVAGSTNLEWGNPVDGATVLGGVNTPTSIAIPTGTNDVTIGTVTLRLGRNYIVLGKSSGAQSGVVPHSLTFN